MCGGRERCDSCGQRVAGLGVDATTLMLGGIVLVPVGANPVLRIGFGH